MAHDGRMTVPADAPALPAPCHDDPALRVLAVPSQDEYEDLQQFIARQIAAPRTVAERELGAAAPLPVELSPTLTRPRFYPPADHAVQWFSDKYPGVRFSFVRALVLHTTETEGWPGYQGGASAPNFTARPDTANRRLIWRQHYGVDESARALRNLSGGVNTNTTNVVQVELIGTSASGGPGMFWPDAPEWALAELAKFAGWLHDTWGVALQSAVTWRSYPASYGTSNGVRLSGAAWLAYRGVLAHEHVTENTHGDTGRFPIERLLELATTPEDDDMPLTDADVAKVASAVWGKLIESNWNGQPTPASRLLARAEEYAIEGGYPYPRPAGNQYPGKPTHAMLLQGKLDKAVAQTDTLEASDEKLQAAVDELNARVGSGAGGQLTRQDLVDVLNGLRVTAAT